MKTETSGGILGPAMEKMKRQPIIDAMLAEANKIAMQTNSDQKPTDKIDDLDR